MARTSQLALISIACACSDGGCGAAQAPPSASAEPTAKPSPDIGPDLRKKLEAALKEKGGDYVPRTKHKTADSKPKYTNRLILQTSPYLLQHAHNPVNWFPWGDEAFQIARALGRPLFLSVGYSTCHWCHVMEEESFEDEEIAKYLNENYICIKVDREERPDVDSIYMAAVHQLRSRGGWPMSVWLTPERTPFFAGTYFPARDGDRGSRKGFLSIIQEQKRRFVENPAGVAKEARRIADQVKRSKEETEIGGVPTAQTLDNAARVAAQRYDPTFGGARGAPKFPSSFPVRSLLRHHRRRGDEKSLEMATTTLTKMAAGGMYDHVGGGFHRYSVDAKWLVPHFEKMLYDNALLAVAYLEGHQATGSADFARVVREILDYVLREMTDPGGGFYSATDADSMTPKGHREEGYFFTWTPREVETVLGPEKARVISAYYGVTARGNFEGRNIFNTPKTRDAVAKELSISRKQLDDAIAEARPLLRKAREKRPPPLRDDKIQVSWNGLMISAFARAAFVLDEPRYSVAAERASKYLLDHLRPGGRLHHSTLGGRTVTGAFLEDYAFFAAALIDVFEITWNEKYLREAITLMNELEERHADPTHGGYFLTANDAEKLLAREKPDYDGAVPSGNSVALTTLLRLSELTTDDKWRARAETTMRAFGTTLVRRPQALDQMMLGVDFHADVPKEIVIVLPEEQRAEDAKPLMNVLRRTFLPNRVQIVATRATLDGSLGKLAPWARGKPAKASKPTAYVCEKGACDLPTSDPAVLKRQIAPKRTR